MTPLGFVLCVATLCGAKGDWPQYEANPFLFTVGSPGPKDSEGGLVAADLDNDGLMDYLVTVQGHVNAHSHDGSPLWMHRVDLRVGGSSERDGLPGHHGPGVAAADINGDGATEVLYLTSDSTLHAVSGRHGASLWDVRVPAPEGAQRWEHLVIANFRGKADRDVLLQATNAQDYRMGRYVAAFAMNRLAKGDVTPLWQRDDFLACAHNGARVADLDKDGKDEVFSGTVLSPKGEILYQIPLKGHIDSIFVADVRPDVPGLELVALEEGGGNRVFLFGRTALLWETDYEHCEPQNAALGEFDAERPGLEIWCRSRFDTDQKPFVFDASGKVIAQYELEERAPEGWTNKGVEVIWTIDWTGEKRQLAAAKARHESGDVCIFDPMTGVFVRRFSEKAHRLYVADVSGDWREELVVLNGNTVRVYHNPEPNPRPELPRLWTQPHYRRSKMTYNYYSP